MSLARTPLLHETDTQIRRVARSYRERPTPESREQATHGYKRAGDREGAEDIRFGPEAKKFTQASHKNLRAQDLTDRRRATATAAPEGGPKRAKLSRLALRAHDIEQKSMTPVGRSSRAMMDRRREEIRTRTGGKEPKRGLQDKATQFVSRMLRRKDLPKGEAGDQTHRRLLARNHGFRRDSSQSGEVFTTRNIRAGRNPTKQLMRSLRRGGHLDTHDAKATQITKPDPHYDPDDDPFGLGPQAADGTRNIKVTLTPKKKRR